MLEQGVARPLLPVLEATPVSVLSPAIASRAPDTRSSTDADLVAAVLDGDRLAEEILYRRHAPGVLRLATRLLRTQDDGLDVLQDTFVTAFEELRDLRDRDALRPWLHRIAVRLVHRRFRKRRLLALLGLDRGADELSLEALADDSASPEARAELRLLDSALARLDDAPRIAWMLRHVEGLSLEEAAIACGCSLATVKRRIAASDALVRTHFGEHA